MADNNVAVAAEQAKPETVNGKRKVDDVQGTNDDAEKHQRVESKTKDSGPTYIQVTTHANVGGSKPVSLKWGAADPLERGPVMADPQERAKRNNTIGAHSGGYAIYRAIAVAAGHLKRDHRPQLEMTTPAVEIGPFPSWKDPEQIVSMDPWGHDILRYFKPRLEGPDKIDVRPTIAVTRAHVEIPEIKYMVEKGTLKPDGKILMKSGQAHVVKAAVEPVWYLPGVAKRFGVDEAVLRKELFHHTCGMYPELVTRNDLKVFLPPVGGFTIYVFGDHTTLSDPEKELTVRVHDECNGSDVFGSDICTCRPYLIHGIEECIRTAQRGGAGVIVYFRKEGRGLGEVTKYLVYNLRKRQEGGDSAAEYFNCTSHVAGVEDVRYQALMPDALHWLGITRIHNLISMSHMKYDAIVSSGIKVDRRVPIPKDRVPEDAQVEIHAKVFSGYHGGNSYDVKEETLKEVKGRDATSYGKDQKSWGGNNKM